MGEVRNIGGEPRPNPVRMATVYDARGNGGGQTAPTMTGDHNAHISDYTTIIVQHEEGIRSSE